jgi:tRNA (uracil-5-)-methyltransferase
VYVSCNPTVSLPRDAKVLCGPKSKRVYGEPFVVKRAQPVDMFPLTKHTEVVMVFERGGEEEEEKEGSGGESK